MKRLALSALAILALAVSAGPAMADVDTGIAAFSKGDFSTARQHLAPAARDGEAQAQYLLGRIYGGGHGIGRDRARAVKLFSAAAEQGHAPAQYDLAYALFMGEGADQDLVEALKWFLLAGHGGVKKSAALSKNVMKILPRDVVHEARTEALTWIKDHGGNPPSDLGD